VKPEKRIVKNWPRCSARSLWSGHLTCLPLKIQLCEIQAAGPQVSTLANALLEGCFDNKFEIRFRTQRPKADGKGMVGDFDVEVRNKNLDRTCLVDELSGGQFVLVNEAVNMGIAIHKMPRSKNIIHPSSIICTITFGQIDSRRRLDYRADRASAVRKGPTA
jgi:hypothetical protein